jgi:hypothetical protein
VKALIKIETDTPALAEQVAKFLINKINGEGRQIAVSKTRRRFGKYEKKVIFGKIREEVKSNKGGYNERTVGKV